MLYSIVERAIATVWCDVEKEFFIIINTINNYANIIAIKLLYQILRIKAKSSNKY